MMDVRRVPKKHKLCVSESTRTLGKLRALHAGAKRQGGPEEASGSGRAAGAQPRPWQPPSKPLLHPRLALVIKSLEGCTWFAGSCFDLIITARNEMHMSLDAAFEGQHSLCQKTTVAPSLNSIVSIDQATEMLHPFMAALQKFRRILSTHLIKHMLFPEISSHWQVPIGMRRAGSQHTFCTGRMFWVLGVLVHLGFRQPYIFHLE